MTTIFDTTESLKTDEEMALHLEGCSGDAGDVAAFIAKALGNIARAHRSDAALS